MLRVFAFLTLFNMLVVCGERMLADICTRHRMMEVQRRRAAEKALTCNHHVMNSANSIYFMKILLFSLSVDLCKFETKFRNEKSLERMNFAIARNYESLKFKHTSRSLCAMQCWKHVNTNIGVAIMHRFLSAAVGRNAINMDLSLHLLLFVAIYSMSQSHKAFPKNWIRTNILLHCWEAYSSPVWIWAGRQKKWSQ